jgi:hypothetical protein
VGYQEYDDINGWIIEGETLEDDRWKEQNFLELNVERMYICCDEFGEPIY